MWFCLITIQKHLIIVYNFNFIKNNDNNFNTDSSIPDKNYFNYLPLSMNSSPQKCLTDTLVSLKCIDLCSEVKSKMVQ